jgi:site-specific DNA recombinase
MTAKTIQPMRCAIYTRKSTEHGIELEFNSLHAQREACEAYIKSQAHEGWRALSQCYDDPAYSGASLERPALQQLLTDVDAGRVNIVVVYKIDRLTRSLADFAKLVELFDKKCVSFVAVTQQFNTTTSMGRLTLNVLLSFAQFERELSSERVRDKVAASRRKGKWTGGGVPLGYDVIDKKLIINPVEAETVRIIFTRYLKLKSVRRLSEELNDRGVVSKRREGRSGRHTGGINLTHGALVHVLKNRTYLGKTHHDGEWFAGEHEPIIDQETFDNVHELMKANSAVRRHKRSENGALLTGLLYDDRGHRMTPSFTTKRDVRYRFYVSTALLKGRKQEAGTLPRISGPDIEAAIIGALGNQKAALSLDDSWTDRDIVANRIDRVEVSETNIRITLKAPNDSGTSIPNPIGRDLDANGQFEVRRHIDIRWQQNSKEPLAQIQEATTRSGNEPDPALVQAVARAHSWTKSLVDGEHSSIESLAVSINMHPKVVRKGIRLAFLAREITEAIVLGYQPKSLSLTDLQLATSLSWLEQRRRLGIGERRNLQSQHFEMNPDDA